MRTNIYGLIGCLCLEHPRYIGVIERSNGDLDIYFELFPLNTFNIPYTYSLGSLDAKSSRSFQSVLLQYTYIDWKTLQFLWNIYTAESV